MKEVYNWAIKKRYVSAGLSFAKRHVEVIDMIHLGLDINYDKKLSNLEDIEKKYIYSGYNDKKSMPFETINFVALAQEHGVDLSKKHLEGLLEQHVIKSSRHAKKYRNELRRSG